MSNEEQEITSTKPDIPADQLVVHDSGDFATLFDTARFNQAWRAAKAFSESKLVPEHFRGSTASCFVAMHMAVRMSLDPMLVMQNTYIINHRPGMEAKLQIALVNARGPFKGPIKWEWKGDNADKSRKCTAYATHRETGERHDFTVDWPMVTAERWDQKDGSKWKTIPDLMFMYRSASFLIKTTCPEVTMGLATKEELEDMEVIDVQTTPLSEVPKVPKTESLKAELKKRGRPPKAPESPQDPPSPEAKAEGQGEEKEGGTSHPRGITADTVKAIETAMEASGLSLEVPYNLLGIVPNMPVAELIEDDGQAILDWFKTQ